MSATQEHVYSPSDDSEGPVLRDFVNETIAQELEHRTQSPHSPRSELLSTVPSSSAGFLAHGIRDSSGRRGPSRRYRQEREQVYKDTSRSDLLRLLIEHEYENSKMRKTLYMVFTRLEEEQQRAANAESSVENTVQQFKLLNDKRLAAEREAQALEEQLTLYKVQYNLAQTEIASAQEKIRELALQRDDAEEVAEKARGDARKVREAMGVWKAREEGRKQGFEDGWRRAREEFSLAMGKPVPALTYENALDVAYPPSILDVPHTNNDDDESSGHESPPRRRVRPAMLMDSAPSEPSTHAGPSDPITVDVVSPSPKMPQPELFVAPPSQPRSSRPPSRASRASRAPSVPHSTSHSISHPIQQPIFPAPPPRPPSSHASHLTRTPAIQMYPLDIPPADELTFNNQPPPVRTNSWRRRPKPRQQQPQQPPPPPLPHTWKPDIPQRRSPSPRPPDNYIPITNGGQIILPPPHELADYASPQVLSTELPEPGRVSSLDGGARQALPQSQSRESWSGRGRTTDARPIGEGSQPPMQAHNNASSSSWYLNKQQQSTSTLGNDEPQERRSMDSAFSRGSEASTNMSHLDILRDPSEVQKRPGLGKSFRNMFKGKGKERVLSVINENPLSRQGSVRTQDNPVLGSPNRLSHSYERHNSTPSEVKQRFVDSLRYENPEDAGAWRGQPSSSGSHPNSGHFRHVRVPSQLTIPSPLSPLNHNQGHGRSLSTGSIGYPSSQRQSYGGANGSQMGASETHSRRRVSMAPSNDTSVGVGVEVVPPSGPPSLADHSRSHASSERLPTVPNSPENNPAPMWPHDGGGGRSSRNSRIARDPSPARSNISRPYGASPSGGTEQPLRPASVASTRYSRRQSAAQSGSVDPGASPASISQHIPGTHDPGESEGLRRVPSSLSMRSKGVYDHYDPSAYVDPAFYGQASS
ncbi:hypothetical protein D9758_011790 [Tetrapyrgos nigripes]|uniref:Uncharacterized protein n=1 Tax=Tetrapyrgos nigripes TaxID=182062 RepID=A0A8H5FUL8_9AGAR|nr:hypothetical protein D9758_011790 [Tetrapyrgos nigripes]